MFCNNPACEKYLDEIEDDNRDDYICDECGNDLYEIEDIITEDKENEFPW